MQATKDITESLRLPSPAPKPLGLAFDGETLWMTAWGTQRLYALDVHTWTVRDESPTPGKPFGIAMIGDELRVIVGIGEADDRYICRFIVGHGFKDERMACPEYTGAHLAFDGDTLFLSQATNSRIVALDNEGTMIRSIELLRRPLGMTIVDGCFYTLTGDNNFEELRITKIDARGDVPTINDVASVPFDARGLAYDGSRFWTSHRDNNEIVAFTL